MRILHLADLHLGKLVHEAPMTEDQAHVLHQVLAMVRENAVDVVAVSGDVYDRAIPPVAATRLMDEFLSELVLNLGVAVILTPGNHDSAERLSFGSRLLSARGLHIAPGLPGEIIPLVLADAHGPVTFIPLPYITPLMLKEREEDLATGDFDEAMARVMASLPHISGRSVCLAHCFTLGGSASESERPLSIGGSCLVDPAHFAPFSLTLLGHLHRPQKVAERAFYAGSPLKYSFSEADHQKSAALYDLDADGGFTRTLLPLCPRRDMRKISGELAALLAAAEADAGREDYLWIELTDRGALFDYAAKLRQSYPNVLSITRAQYGKEGGEAEGGISVRGKTEWEITTAFFRHVSGQDLDEAEADALRAVVDEMLRADALGALGETDVADTPGAAPAAATGEMQA
ncbi:MAG TPA: exonuclease SbcCD subunit D [Humidesulfovibrio sp.]|uniref:exonuclease SbcCD subunit D n=1 Tax=Humidesulfovibrio sp. TaxID=2910988 RepID=UPI002BF01DA1|nr:exonuclease SbcCD subunit D [Humidesulfovibrio sp.]HWR02400.1 exonuclease SbcCD subunit D [Humidesulfovibrio sp.]